MTPKEVLIAARALISDPSKWTQQEYARDDASNGVGSLDESAVCWCSYGAIERAAGTRLTGRIDTILCDAALDIFNSGCVSVINDSRSHADVLRMFDRAIELASAKTRSETCNPRTNYEMTQTDCDAILEACKPVPYMVVGGAAPASPQERANDAWAELGKRMGFDHMTVRPIDGKSMLFFSAVPNETESQRDERLSREKEVALKSRIATLESEIAQKQQELASILP